MKKFFVLALFSCALSTLAAQTTTSVNATVQPSLQPSVATATAVTIADSGVEESSTMHNVEMTVVPSTQLAPVTASVTVDVQTEETRNTDAQAAPAVQEQMLNLSAKPAPTGVETKTESPK